MTDSAHLPLYFLAFSCNLWPQRMGLLAMRESPDDDATTTSTVAGGADYKQTFADVLNMPTNAEHFKAMDPSRCAGSVRPP